MKVQRRYSNVSPMRKENPLTERLLRKGVFFLVLTAREASVKPLADVMRDHICCDGHDQRRYILHIFTSLPVKMGGVGRRISITYFSAKRYNKTPAVHSHDRRFLFNSYFSYGISFASSARTSSPRCSSFVFG